MILPRGNKISDLLPSQDPISLGTPLIKTSHNTMCIHYILTNIFDVSLPMYLAPLSRIRRLSNIDIEFLTRIFSEDGWGRGIYYFHANIIAIIICKCLQYFTAPRTLGHPYTLAFAVVLEVISALDLLLPLLLALPQPSLLTTQNPGTTGFTKTDTTTVYHAKQDLFLAVGHINWPAAMTI